jgi:hypothetical protein
MNEIETGEKAEPFFGDKLYQQRARAALPLLVRQAKAQQTVYYSDLAEELGMSNARNLNFVLGSVGRSLIQLGKERNETIPPIQCLVVNRAEDLPGEGIVFFISKGEYLAMSKRQRRVLVTAELQKIFAYPKWDAVLAAFSMQPATSDFSKVVRKAVTTGRGGGESEHHRLLKEYVATHPALLRLPTTIANGVSEYLLPSGDEVDVLFREGQEWIGVEVKSHISGDDDLVRGLFQCVKYHAVLEAFLLSTARSPNVRTVLVTGRPWPDELLPLRNILGVEVIYTALPTAAT